MSTKRHPVVRELFPVAILLLAAIGFHWRILFTGEAWKPAGGGDLVSFLFPTYRFAAASLKSGTVPLWNPHLYGGAPFLADMQAGLFYPLNLLLFWVVPEFAYETLQWMVVLHVFLAGLFMYLCLRYLEPGRQIRVHAALAGAIAYMFSDLFIVHFGNLNLVAVAAWLPLIFLLLWRAQRARSLGLAVAAGAAFGISTLEGHLQITLYIGLALVVATVVEAATARRSGRGWAWSLLALVVTTVVALGLSALVLLPTFEYARLSPRAGLSYQEAARYSLEPGLLGEMLVPALFSSREPSLYWGVWDRVAVGYLGIFPLILAMLAVLMRRGRRIVLYVSLAVAAFLLALGGASIAHGWAYRLLPGFAQIRAPARAIFVVDFGLAALAALALDQLLGPLAPMPRSVFRRVWPGLVWFGAAASLIGVAWAYLAIYQAQGGDPVLFWRVSAAGSGVMFALLMLAASLAWLGARRAGRLRRGTLAWLAVGLIFLDLASVGAYTDMATEVPTGGFDHPQILAFLENQPGLFRIDSQTDVWGVWQPSLALLAELDDVGGIDNPLVVADVDRYMEGTGGRSTKLYDLLGVRYVLGTKQVTLDWEKFSLAFDADPEVNLYRNETVLPRAFVVHQAVVATDHEDAWGQIHQPGFDPATTVVLEGGEAMALDGGFQDNVEVVRYGINSLEIEVETGTAGYLFLSDPFYPGWQAEVDGEPAQLLRADYAFRAVAVPAGSHRVTMEFRSGSWYAGLGISAFTVAVLILLGVWVVLRRRRGAA
jgi:hypothetical protein